jgi:CHASE3 domain sensor protein
MKHSAELVSSIENKLDKLVGEYKKTLKAIGDKEKEIEFLTNSNEEQKKQVRLLEEKIKLLKITKATEIKEGAAGAKLKINELVREIDKCIGLMNL